MYFDSYRGRLGQSFGHRRNERCRTRSIRHQLLILLESGLDSLTINNVGVFPLRGKLINVRDAKPTAAFANEEVRSIMQILGLKPHTKYSDTKTLRYGSVMIMTDQVFFQFISLICSQQTELCRTSMVVTSKA
jgi:hypothetical protein